jgi:hypothetical protein
MIEPVSLKHLAAFYGPWAFSLAAAALGEPRGGGGLMIQIDALSVPALQGALAVAGVLLARPLAPRREMQVGWPRFAVVTAIMLIVAVVWVAQSRPGPLLAFVVSIGLGFSGYSLIEFAGREIEGAIRRLIGAAAHGHAPGTGPGSQTGSETGNGNSASKAPSSNTGNEQ